MRKRKVLVVGLGVSGKAICEALASREDLHSLEITVTDTKPESEIPIETLEQLSKIGCKLILGTNNVDDLSQFDEVIVSPGVPLEAPILEKARIYGIPIVGELEWAWRYVNSPVIAVTGTNGKTTTTELIGSIMKRWGKRAFVGGNIGVPLSRAIIEPKPWDIIVLEVSSFQLDTAPSFSPDIFIVLNITEDHLDRYASFDDYARSKMSPILRKKKEQWAIVNGDDKTIERLLLEAIETKRINPDRVLSWSRQNRSAHGFIRDGKLLVRIPNRSEVTITLENSQLRGGHNQENMAAAAMASIAFGVPPEVIEEVFINFPPGHHRIEFVDSINGVEFYDDSKATNVDAVVRALEFFEKSRIWLLLGGRDKGGSYERLLEEASRRCRGIVVFGEARSRILEAIRSWHGDKTSWEIFETENLERAFMTAAERARTGEIVLLSPACSSFDHYRSYAERGNHFKQLVKEWKRLKGR
ncbi:MAG: UDP-N-acetylmuramoyl-L-alanine--D-glutamate ligase [Syntrophobacterales bacterium]|nr:UDP-N-acetylmuramoyl-L-alanine--D-glutamate ligase [Syntrophobacterales bacterium]